MRAVKNLCAVIVLTFVLMAMVLSFREWAYTHWSPFLIDYDAPGVDITSEGPDDDFLDIWNTFGGDVQ